jgi:hypothetical protein
MRTFIRRHVVKKPSVVIVFLFLVVLGLSEFPEHIRLRDDVSNDFVVSAGGHQSVKPRGIGEQGAIPGSGPVEVVSAQTVRDPQFPSVAEPFHLAGQDRLLLWSIRRT